MNEIIPARMEVRLPGQNLPPPAAEHQESAFAVINDRLRGRLKYAITLGILLGVALSYAGYTYAPVKYASSGQIHVASSGSAILRETPDTAFLPRYEGYRRTHELYVISLGVRDRALRNPKVAALPFSQREDAIKVIKDNLKTSSEYNSELITVTYEADDPQESVIVINAILEAYDEIHGGKGGTDFRDERMQQLTKLRDTKLEQRDGVRQQLQEIINNSEYGATNLDQVLQAKLLRIETIKYELESLDLALAGLPASSVVGDTEIAIEDELLEPTILELEILDPELAILNQEYEDLLVRISQLTKHYSARHPNFKRANRELEMLEEKILSREDSAKARWFELGGILPSVQEGGNLNDLTPNQLRDRRNAVKRVLDKNQQDVRAMNMEQGSINEIQNQLTDIETRLGDINDTIDLLRNEENAQFSGRIMVKGRGVEPRFPSKDRRKPMALVGFFGGFGLSCALFFMLGSIDRRTYSASQLINNSSRYRCLGVLPYLGANSHDSDLAETAAQCVHQIRNRIEALRDPNTSSMLVVTSPYQGDGKTSLAMALGWSYAASGYRTLMMDCDFLGRNLTGQMGLAGHSGVKEALRDRRLDDQIVDLPVPNLSALVAGADAGFGPESIRRDDFAALCVELRLRFDIIITDTGPFIGSVELLPVTAAADGVVFSVRRGRSRSRLEECLQDLDTINVPCLGVVLNCADKADCNRYVSKSTISMRHMAEEEAAANGHGKPKVQPVHNVLVKAMERTAKSRN
ncbi:MAG: hypothetical protein O7G85_01820 [Planctomycetota bacterium]|nr:hypothetical protein [Planctomycetota bacterium]